MSEKEKSMPVSQIEPTEEMIQALSRIIEQCAWSRENVIKAWKRLLPLIPVKSPSPVSQTGGRPESVQAAFEVFAGKPDTGPHATSMFRYIESLEATVSRFRSERSYVVGCNTGFEAAIEQTAAVAVGERERCAEAAAAAVMKFRHKAGGKYYPGYHEDMRDAVREAVLSCFVHASASPSSPKEGE